MLFCFKRRTKQEKISVCILSYAFILCLYLGLLVNHGYFVDVYIMSIHVSNGITSIMCLYKRYYVASFHGGEARDLKLEIPGNPPTVRICISLIFSLIMVVFAWGLKQSE